LYDLRLTGVQLAPRWRPNRPGIVIGVALCVSSTQAAIVVTTVPTIAVAALELVTGITTAVCFTVWETALQQRIQGAAQARVSSFDYLGSLALMPLGYLVMNPLGQVLGIRPAAIAATVISLVISLLVAFSRDVRALRTEPVGPRSGTET
jgi:Na+-driven multidrug efflux pump